MINTRHTTLARTLPVWTPQRQLSGSARRYEMESTMVIMRYEKTTPSCAWCLHWCGPPTSTL
eukprot:1287339-Rhodomonas_salina.1